MLTQLSVISSVTDIGVLVRWGVFVFVFQLRFLRWLWGHRTTVNQ